MATLVLGATGLFTAAGTWKQIATASGAEVDSQVSTVNISTGNSDSATFILAAEEIDAILVRFRSVITPTGTFTAILRNSTTSTDIATVTINASDFYTLGSGWYCFAFAAHTPNG